MFGVLGGFQNNLGFVLRQLQNFYIFHFYIAAEMVIRWNVVFSY